MAGGGERNDPEAPTPVAVSTNGSKSEAADEAWLEHWKRARTGAEREGRVDPSEFGFA